MLGSRERVQERSDCTGGGGHGYKGEGARMLRFAPPEGDKQVR